MTNAPILRPYQAAALDRVRDEYRRGVRSVLLVAPTGAGKTVMFCAIAQGAIAKGKRVIVVVHRSELVGQTIAKMRAFGVERIGVIAPGWAHDPEAPIQVGMVQTMVARRYRPKADLVVLDEAHHHVADDWGRVASAYTEARMLGVTATPQRGDGKPLGNLFSSLVVGPSVRELIDAGHLSPVTIVAPQASRRHLADSPVAAYSALAAGRPAVFFCATVAEAYATADTLTATGVPAACVEGEMDSSARDGAIRRFANGELQALTNVFCLTEGWDCPRVEVCVLARGCGTPGAYVQMVGRVLRPSPGKTSALVIDLRGAVHKHGLPDEDREYSLGGSAISGARAQTRSCPECDTVVAFSVRVCPSCGYEWPVAEAVPQQIVAAPLAVVVKRSKRERDEEEREFWDAQVAIVSARRLRPGWAAHRFQEKFGRFPAKFWRESFPKPEQGQEEERTCGD
jgi:DNA repair protein RadD